MLLKDISGNDKVIERLQSAALSGHVSHAYIFEGESSIDKKAVAKAFIKAIICVENHGKGCDICLPCRKIEDGNYEDIHYAEATGASIKDEVISGILRNLRNKPVGGERNIAIIKDADTMTVKAQNRLLKTLEEPPEGAVIILLAENKERLLKTVRSRCVSVRLEPFMDKDESDMASLARDTAKILREKKTFRESRELLADILNDKENAKAKALIFLDVLERFYRDALIGRDPDSGYFEKIYICEAIDCVEKARKDIQMNIGVGYALKNMIIEIGG